MGTKVLEMVLVEAADTKVMAKKVLMVTEEIVLVLVIPVMA